MKFYRNLLILSLISLVLGFASCSSDDNEFMPMPVDKGEWTLYNTKPTVVAPEETKQAIEEELSKSPFMVKSLALKEDGTYESSLAGYTKGSYSLKNDSLYLVPEGYSEPYEGSSIKVYSVAWMTAQQAILQEDLTTAFSEKYEGVESVVLTLDLKATAKADKE